MLTKSKNFQTMQFLAKITSELINLIYILFSLLPYSTSDLAIMKYGP